MIDFAALAHSMGASGRIITKEHELEDAILAPVTGPLVLDVRVDPDYRLGGSQRNAALRQFKEPDAC